MATKHQLVVNVIDHQNNQLDIGFVLPMDCNLNTALTAAKTLQDQLRARLDVYAQSKGYRSAKEMPRNFVGTLTLGDITPEKKEVKP